MKKILSLLLLTSIYLSSFGQGDIIRIQPVSPTMGAANYNRQRIVDANLKIALTLNIPTGTAFTHNNSTPAVGNIFYNTNTQQFAVWNGSTWQVIGGSSAAATWGNILGTLADQTDLMNALNAKQATLVSGSNIKTINGNSLLGSGNLTIGGGVTSVFGRTGDVVAQASDYNSFYPLLSGSYANPSWITSLAYSKITGVPSFITTETDPLFDTKFSGKTTTNLTEGTNLYYTQGRFNTSFSAKSTTDLAEGTNLYFTQGRVSANTDVTANTAARHNAITLGTTNGLSLTGQQLSLGLASSGVTGALSGSDWDTFNSKQNQLTLTTTGSGAASLIGSTLNIPTPSGGAGSSALRVPVTLASNGTLISITWATYSAMFGATPTDLSLIESSASGDRQVFTNWYSDDNGVTYKFDVAPEALSRNFVVVISGGSMVTSGNVTSVTSANGDISVTNSTTTPVLTLNSGTGANQIVKRNGSGVIADLAPYLLSSTAATTYQTLANLSTDLTASSSKYPNVNAVNTGLSVKADDSNVVHKTGNETIAGIKNFTGDVTMFVEPLTGKRMVVNGRAIQTQQNDLISADTLFLNSAGGDVWINKKFRFNSEFKSLIIGDWANLGNLPYGTGDVVARGSAETGNIPKYRTQAQNIRGYFVGDRVNGSFTAPTPLVADDEMVSFLGNGFPGTNPFGVNEVIHSSEMRAVADENWSLTQQGSRWDWYTVHNGTTGQVLDMRLSGSGILTSFGGVQSQKGYGLTANYDAGLKPGWLTKHSTVGTTLVGITGSVFDLSLYSAGLVNLLANPTGTNDLVLGDVSSTVAIRGKATVSTAPTNPTDVVRLTDLGNYATTTQLNTKQNLVTLTTTSSPTSFNQGTGALNIQPYLLPTASSTVLGGVKVGSGLAIDGSGILSTNDKNIADFYTDAPNSSTTETDLYTFSLPSNTISTNGNKITATFGGVFTQVTNSDLALRLRLGGVSLFSTGFFNTNTGAGYWGMTVLFIRTGTTTGRATVIYTATNAASNNNYTTTLDVTGLDYSNSSVFKLTGQGSASGQLTAKTGNIKFEN